MAIIPSKEEPMDLVTYWIKATGEWQPIEIQSKLNFKCNNLAIICHTGHEFFDECESFQLSSNSDGSGWLPLKQPFTFPVMKDSGIVCYVKGKAGLIFGILLSGNPSSI